MDILHLAAPCRNVPVTFTLDRMTPQEHRAAIIAEVETAYPPVAKPHLAAITAHESGCFECEMLQEELSSVEGPWLSDTLVRSLHQELYCISTAGLRWILPSYLRRCVRLDAAADAAEIEFLIYQLTPKEGFREDLCQRWGALSVQQLACLSHFLDWALTQPHWNEWPEQVASAQAFVRSLVEAQEKNAV